MPSVAAMARYVTAILPSKNSSAWKLLMLPALYSEMFWYVTTNRSPNC